MKYRKTLVIWRDDHLADFLGGLFLIEADQLQDSIVQKLKQYFGNRVNLLQAVMSGDRIEVEVEAQGLREASDRLVAAAAGLRRNGLVRSALGTLEDALELDALNGNAYREIGAAMAAAERYRDAFAALVRARETGGDSAKLLTEIAIVCLRLDRVSAAMAYAERALILEPRNFIARRILSDLRQGPRPSKSFESGVTARNLATDENAEGTGQRGKRDDTPEKQAAAREFRLRVVGEGGDPGHAALEPDSKPDKDEAGD